MSAKIKQNKKIKTYSLFVISFFLMTAFLPVIQTGLSEANDSNVGVNITCVTYADETLITYDILGYNTEEIVVDEIAYLKYSIPDESNTHEPGHPDIELSKNLNFRCNISA